MKNPLELIFYRAAARNAANATPITGIGIAPDIPVDRKPGVMQAIGSYLYQNVPLVGYAIGLGLLASVATADARSIPSPTQPVRQEQQSKNPVVIPPVVDDRETPTPQATPTPVILTNRQILEQELFQLPESTRKASDYLIQYVNSDGVITNDERDAVLAVARNPLYVVVDKYDDLTNGLNPTSFMSLYGELGNRTYSQYLKDNLDRLGIALNAKVLVEDMYNDEPDIGEMNGSYIFTMDREEKLLIPLDNETLKKWYPDENKRMAMLMNLWFVPDWNYSVDLAKKLGVTSLPVVGYEAKKANLEMLPRVYEAITRAYNNPDFNVVCTYLKECMSEHQWARRGWNDWLTDRANNNWPNTVAAFRDIDRVISSDPEFAQKWDEMKFTLGYARNSHLVGFSQDLFFGDEGPMIRMLPIIYNAFGVPVTRAMSAPSDGLAVTEFVIGGVPIYLSERINQEFNKYGLVDFGDYSIGLYLPRTEMEADGANELIYDSPLTRYTNGIIWKK